MPLPQSKNKVGLGRALANRKVKDAQSKNSSEFHTTDINNYGSTSNLRSVTHEGDLEEFLNTAQLADADFTAERRNVTVISAPSKDRRRHNPYLLTGQEEREVLAKQALNKERLRVPRRPAWTSATTRAQLERKEKDSFLEWRRGLAELQEGVGLVLTPFERNIEVWRQLWRVIERSHLVVQIVDARNPLRFRCEDLEKYVQGLNIATSEGQGYVDEANGERGKRRNLLLINKADLLDDQQRREWAKYFDAQGIQYAFFSALNAAALQAARAEEEQRLADEAALAAEEAERKKQQGEDEDEDEEDEEEADGEDDDGYEGEGQENGSNDVDEQLANATQAVDLGTRDAKPLVGQEAADRLDARRGQPVKDALVSEQQHGQDDAVDAALSTAATDLEPSTDPCRVLNVLELEELFMACAPPLEDFAIEGAPAPSKLVVGLVGYPNVGKSSTINALLGEKKVSVSATPGKTKHFQTIHLSPETVLCDCPGLVFPQFATTSAELVTDGVLPIDQMREFTAPAELVAKRIPKDIIEATYGIRIDTLPEEEGGTGVPTGLEMLHSYAIARGYTRQGQSGADESRAVRYVLKDYVNAKLLYNHPPPGLDGDEFNAAQRQRIRAALAARRQEAAKAGGGGGNAAAAEERLQGQFGDDVDLDDLDEADLDAMIAAAATRNRATPTARPSAKSLALDSAFFDAFASSRPNIQGRKGMGGVDAIRGKIANDGTSVGPEATTANLMAAKAGKKHHKANKRKKQRSGAGFD
ncbi:uncharacterized protein PFL1_03426 [Pseudozyma flocculosa PF-1]|uniref:CP-type G domain-containing protein n=1 Tax=Pseudozyma flocculosa PF-1 TaxID=1277687 RepID=A0A061H933_9BASI|nr:uncharacterized protein PFL1_03426 [Pseudozyma flocculosa PF-1]EPQ29138.1 hypothetical protein PFL1_03426 [Pseudozyma flocculosa PF-1]